MPTSGLSPFPAQLPFSQTGEVSHVSVSVPHAQWMALTPAAEQTAGFFVKED